MAALASRSMTENTVSFVRRSFNLIRTLSTSAPPSLAAASSAAAEVAEARKSKRRKKNLFEVAQFLPNWGIGFQMAKSHWRDVSYEITKINLYKDGRHGKAWGIRHKAGIAVADAPVKISGVHKRGWKYIADSKKKVIETRPAEEPTPA
ncbi:uncharacterized protein A4U43_C07F620 [Asparagus officinalis]|uniref:Uncharacterized protein n=1 Tax=Asparagus officinalis TaxID=4686 RepID=A0A5P1E857_ASPOF|nr:uncharacterized protein LOC109848188 [Asparagus officinalis]ONK62126.1 uncharacterized protein A4U43_C07F620 [Asparagus officinalis]